MHFFGEIEVTDVLGVCTLALVTLFFGWFLYRWILFNYRSYPPGPIGFPFIGHIGILMREPHQELFELSKKYGKIFSLYFGSHYLVSTTDYEIGKELVSHSAALSRPNGAFRFIPGGGGFAGASGIEWQEQRRFFVTAMKSMWWGKGRLESTTKDHVIDFIEEVSSWQSKPTDIGESVTLSIASSKLSLLIGRRISKKSTPETIQLVSKVVHVLDELFGTATFSAIMPRLTKYLTNLRIGKYHRYVNILHHFSNFIRGEVNRHLDSNEEGKEDIIGSYLNEMKKHNASSSRHYFSVDNLVGHLIFLFFASSDTTRSSLHWLLLLVAAYPEVQKKVQQEVEDVIGKNGEATWDERKEFPYTMATILEMERFVAVNHLFPPRICTETFECAGYTIPKGSRIVVNSWAVMHDPNYWNDPMEFIPERFIGNHGNDSSKAAGLSAFSFGRRRCPGEDEALMTTFLFFTAVMQKFTIKPPSGCTADLTEGHVGAVASPAQQKLCFVERD